MADENVVTGIDALFKYVTENGEVDIPSLAAALGVSEATIQSWSTVLEKSRLVTITYKLGKMFVSPITANVRTVEAAPKAGGMPTPARYEKLTVDEIDKLNQVKSSILGETISEQMRAADQLEPQLKLLRTYLVEMQKTFRESSVGFRAYVAELDAYRAEANKSLESIGNSKTNLGSLISELNTGPGTAQGQENIVNNLDTISKNTEALIEDIRGKASSMSSYTDDMIKQFELKTDVERRKLIAFSESVKTESKRLESFSQSADLQLSSYKKQADAYKRSFERYLSKASKDREAFIDRYTKAQANIDALYGTATKKFKNLDQMLSTQAVELQKLGSIEKKLEDAQHTADEIEAQKMLLKKELEQFQRQLQELTKVKKGSAAERSKDLSDIEIKTAANADMLKGQSTKLMKTEEALASLSELPLPEHPISKKK